MNLKILVSLILTISCSHIKAPKNEGPFFKPVWIKNLDPKHETGNLPMALNSPIIHEGLVFTGHNSGLMGAYELSNGRNVWLAKENSTYHGGPSIYKDQIIYGSSEGRVYSRHFLTGNLKYAVDLGSSIESKAVIVNGRAIFHTRNHKIFCLDVESGKVLWAYKRSVPYSTTIQRVSNPFVSGNNLYAGFGDGYIVALSFDEGVVLWEKKLASGSKFIDVDATVLDIGNEIVVGSIAGDLYGLDPKTGNVLRRLDYSISRSPVRLGGNYFIGTVNGEVVKFDLKFNELKKIKLSDGPIASMAIFKGRVIVATSFGHLKALEPDELQIIGSKFLGHAYSTVYGDIHISEDRMALMSSRNRLYIFK